MLSASLSKFRPTSIRLPDDLKQWLEERSARHFRSQNSELIAILDAIRNGEASDPNSFREHPNP